MGDRRTLAFERLDQVMPEVDRLLVGHVTSGTWTLGQILHHLASGLRLTMEVDAGPTPGLVGPELARAFEVRRRRLFRAGRFPEGATVPIPAMVPPVDTQACDSAESLRSLIREFDAFGGTFPPHPLLGSMTKDEWATFHRLHCAHHLGFARPTEIDLSGSGPDPGDL